MCGAPDRAEFVSTVVAKSADVFSSILRCPICRSELVARSARDWLCTNPDCEKSNSTYGSCRTQPLLIDFSSSIFSEEDYADSDGSVLERDPGNTNWRVKIGAFILSPNNPVAKRIAHDLVGRLKRSEEKPLLLVIGGGVRGAGTEPIYDDPDLDLVSIDVYASPHTDIIADAHRLPFADASFDAVWIQAVLEHVLMPHVVAEEIHRVLKPGGLLFADTPFMQQVHEGAYDFTRFTLSGHRWLFHNFEEIESGTTAGAGTASVWSLRYLWRALGLPSPVATLLTAPFFWLRFFDSMTKQGPNADAASGVYFFGSKAAASLSPKDIVPYYRKMQRH